MGRTREVAAGIQERLDLNAVHHLTLVSRTREAMVAVIRHVRGAGISVRIPPGVLPIADYDGLRESASRCGAYICEVVDDSFAPIRREPEAVLPEGMEYAVEQCANLVRQAPRRPPARAEPHGPVSRFPDKAGSQPADGVV